MSKSRLFGACLLACVSIASMNASATDYVYGAVVGGDNALGVYGVGTGSFSDTIGFTLGSVSNVDGTVANALNVSFGATTYYGISGLTAQLYKGLAGSGVVASGAGLDFTATNLAAGNYYVQVSGVGTGLGDKFGVAGAYGVGLNVDVPVITGGVPEPETWAMMLAGLGIAGSVVRRKKADALALAA